MNRLYQNTLQVLQTAELKDRMAKLGAEPMIMTPQQFDAYIRTEIATNAALVSAAAIKVN